MPSLRSPDLATLLDHAYAPAPSLAAWLELVTQDLAAVAPGSLGAVGRVVHQRDGAAPRLCCPYATAVDCGRLDRDLHAHARTSQHRVDLVDGARGLGDFLGRCEQLGPDAYLRELAARFRRRGVGNLHHLTARDDRGHVVSVGLLSRSPSRSELPRLMWKAVAAHLESAFQLQTRLHEERARAPARLRDVVDRLGEPIADATPLSATSARAIWDGLVGGTWSVVARRDRGGRRHVVAVPLAPGARDARALSRREAQVAALAIDGVSDKEIAFVLGLARSTVAGHLREALWKLGLRSRLELLRAFRVEAADADPHEGT